MLGLKQGINGILNRFILCLRSMMAFLSGSAISLVRTQTSISAEVTILLYHNMSRFVNEKSVDLFGEVEMK